MSTLDDYQDAAAARAQLLLSATDPSAATQNELLIQAALLRAFDTFKKQNLISPGDVSVLLAMVMGDFNDWIASERSLAAFAQVMNIEASATIIANDASAMASIAASARAMEAIVVSPLACTVVADSPAAMTAVIASSTAMTAVAASSTAMTAVAASSTAMTAVLSDAVALNAVVKSAVARASIVANTTANAQFYNAAQSMATLMTNNPTLFSKAVSSAALGGAYSTQYVYAGLSGTAGALSNSALLAGACIVVVEKAGYVSTNSTNAVQFFHLQNTSITAGADVSANGNSYASTSCSNRAGLGGLLVKNSNAYSTSNSYQVGFTASVWRAL
jgi:hypothetical protein